MLVLLFGTLIEIHYTMPIYKKRKRKQYCIRQISSNLQLLKRCRNIKNFKLIEYAKEQPLIIPPCGMFTASKSMGEEDYQGIILNIQKSLTTSNHTQHIFNTIPVSPMTKSLFRSHINIHHLHY